MANSAGRLDGAEKASRHRELCSFYVAVATGLDDADDAPSMHLELYRAVHAATQQLTDRLDDAIGFPLASRPDYEALAPMFFEQFHALALTALADCGHPRSDTTPAVVRAPHV